MGMRERQVLRRRRAPARAAGDRRRRPLGGRPDRRDGHARRDLRLRRAGPLPRRGHRPERRRHDLRRASCSSPASRSPTEGVFACSSDRLTSPGLAPARADEPRPDVPAPRGSEPPPRRPRPVARYLTRAVTLSAVRSDGPRAAQVPHARGGRPNAGIPQARPRGVDAGAASAPARREGASKPTIKIGSDGFDEARVVAESTPRPSRPTATPSTAPGSASARKVTARRARERPDRPQARVHRQRPRLLRRARRPTTRPRTRRTCRRSSNGKGGGITVLDYTPGQDTNAFVVRKETADQFKPHQDERPDGGRGRSSSGASRRTARRTRSAPGR